MLPKSNQNTGRSAQQIPLTSDGKPDIQTLMANIRAEIQAKAGAARAKGQPFRPMAPNFEGGMAKTAKDLVHSEELRYLNANFAYGSTLDLSAITSHRPGVIGKAIVFVKRLILRFVWNSLFREYLDSQREFSSNLVRYLNDMSKYVAERDANNFWELVKKIDVDVGKALERIERIADEQTANTYSSERRFQDAIQTLHGQVENLKTRFGEQQAAVQTATQVAAGVERVLARFSVPDSTGSSAALQPVDYSYLMLENRFRGSEEEISARLKVYLPYFADVKKPVLEVGCGRGELQELFRSSKIPARAIDLDQAMVQVSRSKGFQVELADALSYLSAQPESSLGGLIAIQVVEHLERNYLTNFLTTARSKMASGSKIILETINPKSVLALSSNYFRDPTHVFPQHPDTLAHRVNQAGFKVLEVKYLSAIPAEAKLQRIELQEFFTPRWGAVVDSLNRNIDQLNELLYGAQDFAIVAEVP